MTNPDNTDNRAVAEYLENDQDRARSVEDKWAQILRRYADDTSEDSTSDDQIQRILRALQSPPALALGGPTRDQIDSTTRAAIDELDLIAHGPADDEGEADQISKELKQALKTGLHGDRVGPASLMEPHELQAAPDRIVPPEEDEPPNSTAADPAANHPPQMSDDTNTPDDDTETETETETDDQTEPAQNEIPVEPEELAPEAADANPGAPGAAGAAAGAANAAGDADDAGGADQATLDDLDIELHDFISEQVVAMIDDDKGLTQEQREIAYGAARVALDNHQEFLRDHLLSSVDESAREIIFDSVVVDPMEDNIEQMIREQ